MLLIDDVRDPGKYGANVVARTFDEGIQQLQSEVWSVLFLDHDLGGKKSGYDILCWLEANPEHWPRAIHLVTGNPVGRQRMELTLSANGFHKSGDLWMRAL